MATSMLALPRGGAGGDAEGRRGILPLGASVAGAGVLMVMAGLVGAYLALKSATAAWPPQDTEFDNYTATTLTLTVLMAMTSLEWAAYGIRKGFRGQALFAFALTIGLALAHLNGLAYLINGFEFAIGSSAYATVVHALCLVPFLAGVVALGAIVHVTLRAIGHQLTAENLSLLRGGAILWHVASIAWVIAYYTVYVTK